MSSAAQSKPVSSSTRSPNKSGILTPVPRIPFFDIKLIERDEFENFALETKIREIMEELLQPALTQYV